MNKNTVSKLCLFASGLVSRMEENKAYFININILYKSGTKNFSGNVKRENGELTLSYQGIKNVIQPDGFTEFLKNNSSNYDSVLITYNERGAKLVIDASDKNVKFSQTDSSPDENVAQPTDRQYIVNPVAAKELLEEIGILAQNGKIKNDKIRKYNQIDYFIELIQKELAGFEDGREIIVMDCACGKSYLSFVLNFYLRDVLKKPCRFVCIDYSEAVIKASEAIAEKLNYTNMEFIKADLKTYEPKLQADIVISLHACDTATDMALGIGIRTNAKLIVAVPCCHKYMLRHYSYKPFDSIMKYGILKARLADTLTDGLRALYLESVGYKVSVKEYISPLETPKNIMIMASYTGKCNKESQEEYESLKQQLGFTPAIEQMV